MDAHPRSISPRRDEARENQTPDSGIFFKVGRVLHEEVSPFQRIEIVRNRVFGRILFLDGLVQTTERDEFYYHEMLVHPALSCHPKPSRVLIVGGGDGGALREVLKHPVKSATMVEIDERVLSACRKHFPWLREVGRDKRAEILVGDGNAFVAETDGTFDVILVDSSDPVGPSTVLHEAEFYRRLRARLNPGGIIAAQAGSLMLHMDSHAAKARFLMRLFKHPLFYVGPVPTYPVGTWTYNFLSNDVDPLAARRLRIPKGLKYYNADVHRAAFALPAFLRDAVD